MNKRYYKLIVLLVLVTFVSGCLVFDNTEFKLTREERQEAEERAKDITFRFFSHHQYPNFDQGALIDLLDDETGDELLIIDPILGPRYSKDYQTLVDELDEHIFLDRPDADYQLKYRDDYKLRFEYGDFNFQEIRTAVLPFRVDFKVFESIEGRELLTDNGTIFFELRRRQQRWWLHKIIINFRELGAVSIDDSNNTADEEDEDDQNGDD